MQSSYQASLITSNDIAGYKPDISRPVVNELLIGDKCAIMESVLQPHYVNSFKMAYIDPPYNTGTKKSYKDTRDSGAWGVAAEKSLIIFINYYGMMDCFL